MTRENKLALIIGFTLILMVGVLVSDHLSRAREVELESAGEAEPDGQAEYRAFTGSLLTEAIGVAQERATRTTPPVAAQLGGTGPVEAPTVELAVHDPVVIRQGAVEERTPAEQLAQATDTVWNRLSLSATPTSRDRAPTLESITGAAPTPARSGREGSALTRPIKHRVAEGESLYKIAERYLGNGNRWREIQAANAKAVGPDGVVGAGVVLDIPILVEVASRPVPAAVEAPASARSAGAGGAGRTYTVKGGDTLGAIAKDLLGSSRRAEEIVRANPGTIDSADEIQVGMVLKIPAR